MNNDLISRDALKKAIKEKLGVYIDGTLNNRLLFGIIDNAPTVDAEKLLVANVTFDENKLKEIVQTEVIEKIKSGELVIKDERPQGEWARHDEWVGGEYVGGFYHVGCPCIDLETAYYSKWRTHFCPNCGVSMKGGAV